MTVNQNREYIVILSFVTKGRRIRNTRTQKTHLEFDIEEPILVLNLKV